MTDVKEHREQDRLRLEACDRITRARDEAERLHRAGVIANNHAEEVGQKASAAWERHRTLCNELKELLRQEPAEVRFTDPDPSGAPECTTGVTANSDNQAESVKCPADTSGLTPQEAGVFCMAYGAERSALGPSPHAPEQARSAAQEAVLAFRRLSKS